MLQNGTTVVVADGEKFNMFLNKGDGTTLKLIALPAQAVDADGKGSSNGHESSSGNPDASQASEDGFSAGIVEYLNQQVLGGHVEGLVVVAAPRALGEMRKHYHKALFAKLQGEISKDLTGHSLSEVEKAIAAA